MLCGKDGNVRLLRSRTTVCSETHAEIGPARSWLKEWTLGFLKTVGSGAPTDAPTDALRLPTTRMCVCVPWIDLRIRGSPPKSPLRRCGCARNEHVGAFGQRVG